MNGDFAHETEPRIPVTVITGFLGSGKTTLLNRILTEQHGMRIAVVENEFGEVGIDDGLVLSSDEEIFEMNNGCICCTVRGDLIRILGMLLKRRDKFDRIIVETTGLADPSPVAQTFFVDEDLRRACRLDAIVTVVDARHAITHLDEEKGSGLVNEAIVQVAFADRILISKVDITPDDAVAAVERRIRSINAFAPIVRTIRGDVPLVEILDVGAFQLDRALNDDPKFLTRESHAHDPAVSSFGFEFPGAFDRVRLTEWLRHLLASRGADIFRCKGIVRVSDSASSFVFQGVHMLLDVTNGPSFENGSQSSRMVFIGFHLDRGDLERGLRSLLVAVP